MKHDYIVYIDEAGDEGFGKLKKLRTSGQSNWLLLGACIVRADNDRKLPSWRDEILETINWDKTRDLHFQHLKHDRRVVACKSLSQKPFGICIIASNKVSLLSHPKMEIFKKKGHLYNYLIRFLLERVTESCQKAAQLDGIQNPSLKVVFSRRGGTDYQQMKAYLTLMRDGKEALQAKRHILWNILNIDSIRVENHAKWAGLQIADVATSAFFKALEPNYFGNYEHTYAQYLCSKLIAQRSDILDCGLTLIPQYRSCPLDNEQKNFINLMREKRRTPGS